MDFIELSGNFLLNIEKVATIQPHGDSGCYVAMAGSVNEDFNTDLILGKDDTRKLMVKIRRAIYMEANP